MEVLLLIAGRSRRFWPLQEKSLFPICGKTLLEHQVEGLRSVGLSRITLVGGQHNLAHARALFPDLPTMEQEDLALGMRGALLCSLPKITAGPVMVVSGNDVIDPQAFTLLLEKAQETRIDGAILAARVRSYFPGGYLTLDGPRIRAITEKPPMGKEPSDLVTIVAHIHNDPLALLHALEHSDSSGDDGYERVLHQLFGEKYYCAVPYEGPWYPVKYPWHLLPLLTHFLKDLSPTIHPTASIHPTAVLEGAVSLDEGARVLPHATIIGPCSVGKRTIIANGALVRRASIGNDCVIGFATEVKASILSDHVWTHMTYLGDSIIGQNVSFGGGSITGNFRLDEGVITSTVRGVATSTELVKFGAVVGRNCRIGIQTGINPGIKIGSGSFISSGVLVKSDIPDGSYATMKGGEMVIHPNRLSPLSPEAREGFRAWI